MSASIESAIADLETKSREHEAVAAQCRDAAATLRKLYNLTPLPPGAHRPDPPTTQRAVRGRKPSREAVVPPRGDVDDPLQARILKFLSIQRTPVALGPVIDRSKASAYLVRKAIDQLVDAGRVVRTGKTFGTRVGIPAVMTAAAAAAKEEL